MAEQWVKFTSEKQNSDFPGVLDIDPQELWTRKEEVLAVDVRRPDEYTGELGHMPGSQHIVLDQLAAHIDDLPTNKTIVFICRSGQRSARATQFAQSHGLKSVYNMKGGMLLWNQMGLTVEGRAEN